MSEQNSKKDKTMVGFVLMTDANFDWPRFRHNLKEDWGISFSDEIKDGAVVFPVDDYNCAISIMPLPIPDGEAEACAGNNVLWKDAKEEVAKHGAHVMVAVMNNDEDFYDPVDAKLLFCKLASAVAKLKNCIGVYCNPTVFEKNFFVDVAEHIKEDQLPVPIMFHAGMYLNKDSLLCGFTYGLKAYGKEEIEVIGSKAQPPQMFNFLMAVGDYVLNGDVTLKDGETIGFTDDQHLSVTYSKAVSFEGMSLKIGFMTE
ncbi:MAG: DUF4261 domain-containing protein [Ruminococcus sp.]|nr:DUF4261 domain-containing protein [Ruminococcus sp.]